MSSQEIGVIAAVLLGTLSRVLVPYLITLRDNPDTKWENQFWVPPIVSLVIALLTSFFVFAALPADAFTQTLTLQGFAVIAAAAWGLTDISRQGQKILQRKPKAA